MKSKEQIEDRLSKMQSNLRDLKKKDGIGTADEIIENSRKMVISEFVIYNLIWVLKD